MEVWKNILVSISFLFRYSLNSAALITWVVMYDCMLIGGGLCHSARNTFLIICLLFLPHFYCITCYFCHDISPVGTAQWNLKSIQCYRYGLLDFSLSCMWTLARRKRSLFLSLYLHRRLRESSNKNTPAELQIISAMKEQLTQCYLYIEFIT